MRDFQLVNKSDLTSRNKVVKNLSTEKISKIIDNSNKQIDIMEINKKNIIMDLEKFEEKYLEIKNNKCLNNLSRILSSKNCIVYYIISIIFSICVLIYSILCFLIKLSKIKFLNRRKAYIHN